MSVTDKPSTQGNRLAVTFAHPGCPRCGRCLGYRRHVRRCGGKRSRYIGYCYPCKADAEDERQRELRREARANRPCETCGTLFTPPRADGRYCSGACRQKAYRRRLADGGGDA